MAKGGQSGSVEVDVRAGHDVGAPLHLAGDAAANSGGARGGGDFVCCSTDAIGTAECVGYASACHAAAAAAAAASDTTVCRVNFVVNMGWV